jgi:hypothetical protein
MWVIYHKKSRTIVGCSADCEPELEKDFALEEVVSGLANAEPPGHYDAIQVRDREQVRAIFNAPPGSVVLRETPKGKMQVSVEEPTKAFLLLQCDAPDVHPVDGIPEIIADGESFTTITVQKVDGRGELLQGKNDNDLLYLRSDYGALFSADGKEPITSIKLKKGQATLRLVSEKSHRVATVQVFNADAGLQDRYIRIEFI